MRYIKSLNEIYVSHLLENAFLPATDDLSVKYIEENAIDVNLGTIYEDVIVGEFFIAYVKLKDNRSVCLFRNIPSDYVMRIYKGNVADIINYVQGTLYKEVLEKYNAQLDCLNCTKPDTIPYDKCKNCGVRIVEDTLTDIEDMIDFAITNTEPNF